MTTTLPSATVGLSLGQLLYTSFPGRGFQLVHAGVPSTASCAFVEQIVHRRWNPYDPPAPGSSFAYLLQLDAQQTLFGWLFDGGCDEHARSHIPYFLAYSLCGPLDSRRLDSIFACLHKGPLLLPLRRWPLTLDALSATRFRSYRPAAPGVGALVQVRTLAHSRLRRGEILDLFFGTPQSASVRPSLPWAAGGTRET